MTNNPTTDQDSPDAARVRRRLKLIANSVLFLIVVVGLLWMINS